MNEGGVVIRVDRVKYELTLIICGWYHVDCWFGRVVADAHEYLI